MCGSFASIAFTAVIAFSLERIEFIRFIYIFIMWIPASNFNFRYINTSTNLCEWRCCNGAFQRNRKRVLRTMFDIRWKKNCEAVSIRDGDMWRILRGMAKYPKKSKPSNTLDK